jgi:hypothetical protein
LKKVNRYFELAQKPPAKHVGGFFGLTAWIQPKQINRAGVPSNTDTQLRENVTDGRINSERTRLGAFWQFLRLFMTNG